MWSVWPEGSRKNRHDATILSLVEQGFDAWSRGDLATATERAEAILALDARQVDALYLKGLVARRQERLDVAQDCFERALVSKADFADPYLGLIELLFTVDRNADALSVWRLALARLRLTPELLVDLCEPMAGNFAAEVGEVLAPALQGGDSPWRMWSLYQQVLHRLQISGAEYGDFLRRMRARFGDSEGVERAEAMALSYCNRVDEADAAYAELLRKYPNVIAFDGELARAYRETGRHAQAVAQAEGLAKIFPDHPDYAFMRSELKLGEGDIAPGLALYESRFARAHGFNSGYLPVPGWRGEPIEGKRLLVFEEQGIGDCIMFGRYLPLLMRRGIRVQYVCRPEIYAIFHAQPNLHDVLICRRGEGLMVSPDVVFHVATVSLGHWLGVDRRTAGEGSVYLQAQPGRVAYWRDRLRRDGRPLVGLVWAGNLGTGIGASKSLPPALVPQVLARKDVAFVSLQMPASVDAAHHHLYAHTPLIHDFGDTLALLECMDLVVSVDTSVAHLAASMGKRTVVLSKYTPDWRWAGEPRPYWYPQVQVLRQARPFDWDAVLAELDGVLANLVNS